MPQFSIIMPCFNAEETLDQAIQSVMEQTYCSWELIVVDDGSTDATPERLQTWAKRDARIRVLQISNRGPAVARNLGASQAAGSILSFLDADDYWRDTKLSDTNRVFENAEIGGAYGQVSFFETVGQEVARSTVDKKPLSIPQLMGENPVCTMSNFSLRRKHFLDHGGLAHGFVHNEDLEWLIRLVGMGVVIQPIASPQVWYRKSQCGLSADLTAMASSRKHALQTARYFGFEPQRADEAQYLRYLSRRALRLDHGAKTARAFALRGLSQNPLAFLSPLKRGLPTALGALAAPALPSALRRSLFN